MKKIIRILTCLTISILTATSLFSAETDERGKYVQFSVQAFQYWGMIDLDCSDNNNSNVWQAENALLANTGINTNHSDYLGCHSADYLC